MQHIEKPGDNDKKTDRPRSVYIATYGCQMNLRDSEVITGMLLENGFEVTDSLECKAAAVLLVTARCDSRRRIRFGRRIGRFS